MTRFIKIFAYAIGCIIIAAVLFAAFLQWRGIPNYEMPKPVVATITSTPEMVVRGERLASMLCNHCHYNDANTMLTGKFLRDMPPMFGKVYSANITQDATHGIGKWTDAELLVLLRTGIKRDGQYAPAYMPKFANMSDEDINAVIAYLKSDKPEVIAQKVVSTPCAPSLFTKFLCLVAMKPYLYPEKELVEPDTTDKKAFGKYLVQGRFACFGCHSGDLTKVDELHPEKSFGYLGGGTEMLDMEGKPIKTRNITFDAETGIGKWTLEEFNLAMKAGIVPNDQPALRYPMIPYMRMTNIEIEAIYEYLKSAPKVVNKVER